MPITGCRPSITGLSWFGVLSIASLPLLLTSHAQPLPNRPRAAFLNSPLNESKLPNDALMASASGPDGSPPAFGAMICQNIA